MREGGREGGREEGTDKGKEAEDLFNCCHICGWVSIYGMSFRILYLCTGLL